jgi:hypothetical protein
MNQASSPAAQLKPQQRQQIALRVLTKQETISGIAEEERVSRKFLYEQGHIAQNALTLAFEKPQSDKEVLFYLPVTQKWLSQLILALILICHCSYRGVVELLRDLFDYTISIGTVHNQVGEAVQQARKINGGVAEVWLSNWNPLLKRVCRIANNTSRTSPEIPTLGAGSWEQGGRSLTRI